jgi:hypothetical protein
VKIYEIFRLNRLGFDYYQGMEKIIVWEDCDPSTPIQDMIRSAIKFYAFNYGRRPDFCVVHSDRGAEVSKVDGVEVQARESVMPHHVLVGVR